MSPNKRSRQRNRLSGHKRQRIPLGPVRPPQRVTQGWRVTCSCGWNDEAFATRHAADAAFSAHVLASKPICQRCKEPKAPSQMSTSSPHMCKRCRTAVTRAWKADNPNAYERHQRKSWLKRKYGMTAEQWDELLAVQGGVCAICGRPPDDPRGYRLQVDHDHKSGRRRGILCFDCNRGLGCFRDQPDLMNRGAAYLRQYANKEEVQSA